MKRLLTFVILAAFAPACGNVPEAKDFNESVVAYKLAECACAPELQGYGSVDACRADHPPSEGEQACVKELFKSIDADFGPTLDCRTGANQVYAGCLNSRSCTDLARVGCFTDWLGDLNACPDFPNDVQKELDECLR